MTDATGKSLLSYRRSRLTEASLLIAAQHDHGIPTWQDQRDLLETPTGDELRRILSDRFTSSALLWITPDVESSEVIRKIEVPGILNRVRVQDGFFLVPVCAGGIDYKRAGEVVDQHLSIDNLGDWNLRRVKSDPIDAKEAAEVAGHILKRRVQAIHRQLDPSLHLAIMLHTGPQHGCNHLRECKVKNSIRTGKAASFHECVYSNWHDLLGMWMWGHRRRLYGRNLATAAQTWRVLPSSI